VKHSYSKILRSIGQDLDARGLKTFVLHTKGDVYVVACGYQEPPSATPVTLHYTAEDVEELDRAGQENRGRASAPKDFVTLTQILRTIGGYLDKNKCRLIAVSNNDLPSRDYMLRVEYVNSDGDRIVDDRTGSAVYDLCVSMYKQRGKDSNKHAYWRPKPDSAR
jgi:hypothetical protein